MRVQAFFLGTSEPTTLAKGALPHTVIVVLSWASIFLGVSLTCFGLVNEARSLLQAASQNRTGANYTLCASRMLRMQLGV